MKSLSRAILVTVAMFGGTAANAQQHVVLGNDNERIASTPKSETQLDVPTVRIKLKGGQTNTLFFQPAGRLQLLVDRTQTTVAGSYTVDGSKVCVVLPVRGNDCWNYDPTAAAGSTVKLTSDRGQEIAATYLKSGALMADSGMQTPGISAVASITP